MKVFTAILSLLALTLVVSGCFSYREYPVEYDYSYHGKFKKYRTYAFLENTSAIPDSTMNNDIIRKVIEDRLAIQGYRLKPDNPNLLVAYKIYFDSLNFQGYDQPDIEQWVKYEKEDEEYNKRSYNLKKGTLLIQMYDRKQERSVWQGYATGVYGNIYFNNERQLKIAVRSILDRYKFLAEDFMENKEFVMEGDSD